MGVGKGHFKGEVSSQKSKNLGRGDVLAGVDGEGGGGGGNPG